jgi:ATP-dependent Clp protease ATP-binding subunit ClpC
VWQVSSYWKEIESHITIRERTSTSVEVPLSHECKRILNYAAEEAERLGHKHIGTEHLVLGIQREDQCLAARILQGREANTRAKEWCCAEHTQT